MTGVFLQLRKSEKEIIPSKVIFDCKPVVGRRFVCVSAGPCDNWIMTSIVKRITPRVGNQIVFTTQSGSIYSLVLD